MTDENREYHRLCDSSEILDYLFARSIYHFVGGVMTSWLVPLFLGSSLLGNYQVIRIDDWFLKKLWCCVGGEYNKKI